MELKPCPFCGSSSEYNDFTKTIFCMNPDCDLGWINISEENWNTRPIEDELQRKLDEWKAAHDNLAQQLSTTNDLLEIAVEALENIVQFHDGYCEKHINISQHSYDLSNIAEEALKKLEEE